MEAAIPRNHELSAEEWEKLKPEIGRLYLEYNCTANEIQNKLREKYNVVLSARKLKVRLKKWEFDDKKIECHLWNAMSLVMQAEGRRCKFLVPIRGGHDVKDITPEEVTKQWKRAQKSTKWRTYAETHPEFNDLNAAHRTLCQQGVRIEKIGLASMSSNLQFTTRPSTLGKGSYEAMEPDLTVSDDGSSLSSASPILSPTESSSVGLTPNYFPSQIPRFIGKTGHPANEEQARQWDRLPSVRKLIKDIEQTTTLSRVDVPRCGMTYSASVNQLTNSAKWPSISTMDLQADEDLTLSFASFAIDSQHSQEQREGWQKFLGLSAADPPHTPQTKEHFYALEWAAYYVQQCLAGFEKLDDRNHPDRIDAMINLQHMVKQCSRWIFPYVNWLATVLGANDKPDQLQECLEDCCTMIDVAPTDHAWVFRVVLHFILATHKKDNHDIRGFGCQLEEAMRYVCHHWGERNVNHFVVRNWHAHYLLNQGQAEAAHHSLSQSLPMYEKCLSPTHLLTVQCLGLLSRACDRLGQVDLAIIYLQRALHQFHSCPTPLRAFYYNLLRRLAGLQIRTGLVQEAHHNLKKVLNFRLDAFGISARTTWNVIRSMVDLMLSHGQQEDARRLNKEMEDLFNQEQAQNYKTFHGHSPPWMQSVSIEE